MYHQCLLRKLKNTTWRLVLCYSVLLFFCTFIYAIGQMVLSIVFLLFLVFSRWFVYWLNLIWCHTFHQGREKQQHDTGVPLVPASPTMPPPNPPCQLASRTRPCMPSSRPDAPGPCHFGLAWLFRLRWSSGRKLDHFLQMLRRRDKVANLLLLLIDQLSNPRSGEVCPALKHLLLLRSSPSLSR